ncbi:MAG: hypothetical protein IJU52_05520 [Clostridia bacterium]|nr:hypothetical protein [Clostridia bacterium]
MNKVKRTLLQKILPLLIAAAMLLPMLPILSSAGASDKYDVNGDAKISIEDVTALLDVLATGAATGAHDINGDEKVSIEDVTSLLDYLANPTQTAETMQDIVDAAYDLEKDTAMSEQKTLTGKIVEINTAYSDSHGNITVTIVVEGREDKPIMCYRLKGTEATETAPAVDVSGLALLDTVTVTGTLKNYKGTIEFDQGCVCSGIYPTKSSVGVAIDEIAFEASYEAGAEVIPVEDGKYDDVTFTYTAQTADGAPAPVVIEDGKLTFGNVNESTAVIVTVTATDGVETLSKTFSVSVVPAGYTETMQDIVDAAYALEGSDTLQNKTLQGVITEITTAYSAQYGNVTVVIAVADRTDKPIQCYRLKNGENITAGEGVEKIKVGDTITVTGTLKKYNGTVEFDQGCTLDSVDAVAQMTEEQKVDAELEKITLPATVSEDTEIDLPSAGTEYTDVAFTWASDCEQAVIASGKLTLAIGSANATATVTVAASCGEVTKTKEFKILLAAKELTMQDIVDMAYELEGGKSLSQSYTLTGKITKVDTVYSTTYKNVTVTITVEGREDKPIMCYRMKNGEGFAEDAGVAVIKVGDVITVSGIIKNYVKNNVSTIEFDANCTLDRIDEVAQLSDEEIIAAELSKIVLPETVKENTEIQLPLSGSEENPNVVFRWSCTGDAVSIGDTGVMVLTVGETTANVTVTVTAEFGEATAEKTFSITIAAPTPAGETVDVLNRELTGVTGSSYTAWEGKSADSSAVWAGQSAGGNDAIQIRSNGNAAGVISTASGGTVKSVTVKFNSNTSVGRTILIYASNTAYTSPTELYAAEAIAELKYEETSAEYTYTFEKEFAFVGIRSKQGAIYLDEIRVTWTDGSGTQGGQGGDQNEKTTDVLLAGLFAATNTTYTEFSGVSVNSDAVYAGQSAQTSKGSIQLRSKNSNSGIVTTESGGKVVSISFVFEEGTSTSNTLDIYGSNTAYESAADLYDSSKQGEKVGSISADGTVTFTGDYAYFGIRSYSGAVYVAKITVEWA